MCLKASMIGRKFAGQPRVRRQMMKILIRSNHREQEVPFRPGETVFNALIRSRVPMDSYCGGKGTCGKCKVYWVQEAREVLACQLPAE
ncbi:MAG TPA: hypothetical protein DDZ66_05635, partial [Firmicutes bacterium]|nr:hypothetical protein [Bacillota bacterium]